MRAEAYVSKSVLNTGGHDGFHGVAAITKLGVGMKGVTGAFGREFLKVDHFSIMYMSFHAFGFTHLIGIITYHFARLSHALLQLLDQGCH